ncbi:SixA phosphatase family protein [Candidatus Mycalebacterium sp.]
MKTLFLIRHAKSDRRQKVADFERPLNERGLSDASKMGERLKGKDAHFDAVYSSPARRAFDTAKLVTQSAGFQSEKIITDERFYTFNSAYLLKAIESVIDERFQAVAVFCHNFAITDLANILTGEAIDNVPACGIAHIETDADLWANIANGNGKLIDFYFPE